MQHVVRWRMSGREVTRRATYLGALAGCVAATLPLETVLGARVYRQPGRLARTLLPVAATFVAWDVAAVRAGWWGYDPGQTSGVMLPGGLPVEEALFFLVVPTCAVLTLEAVRARRPAWLVGDELVGDELVGDEPVGDQ